MQTYNKIETKRYFELDWLRVVLVLAIFLHHIFMPFNGDHWHIMNKESSKLLDDIMVYFEQVRLQTLFFIAGAGSLLLLRKSSIKEFILSKFYRLFVPLIFAMMFINPLQSYFEHITSYSGIFDAYTYHIFSFDPKHLWFIEFLIIFMMLAIPISILLDSIIAKGFIKKLESLVMLKHGLFSLVFIIVIVRGVSKYFMPSQSHDIENLSITLFFLLFFLAGMFFISSEKVWRSLADNRKTNLKWFIFSSLLFYVYYFNHPNISKFVSLEILWQIWWFVCSLVSWSALLVFVGYASVFFKRSPKWLYRANNLIYPFYILHQTVIVAFAFYIVQWDQSIAIKSFSLLICSFIVCSFLCYFLIRPFLFFRFLFGLKLKNENSKVVEKSR